MQSRQTRARIARAIAVPLLIVVVAATVFHFFGDALLNRFVRPRLERAFAAVLPGSAVHLGELRFGCWGNCLQCDGVALTRADGAPVSVGSLALTGVQWGRLLVGVRSPEQIFARARLELTDFSAVLPGAEYRVQCGNLRLSVPDASIAAEALTLQLAVSEEAFFAAAPFRRARYRVTAPSGSLRGVDFPGLLRGEGYRAQSLDLADPVCESLVDREKPRRPLTMSGVMPHEMLAAIAKPFRLDRLTIRDGLIRSAARRFAGAEPGVLTFTGVQIGVSGIANAAAGGQAIELTAEGRMMDAGTLTVQMRLPVAPPTLAFHYSGKLSAMDLTRLDGYMNGAGRVQIKSGTAGEVSFDVEVVGGHATGTVRGEYRNLHVTVVDQDTGSKKGVVNRVATVLTNQLKVRNENIPDKTGALKAGKVDYARRPEETFLQFAWFALRSGVLDLISLQADTIP